MAILELANEPVNVLRGFSHLVKPRVIDAPRCHDKPGSLTALVRGAAPKSAPRRSARTANARAFVARRDALRIAPKKLFVARVPRDILKKAIAQHVARHRVLRPSQYLEFV
jgi:hypothetical protein